MNRVNPSESQKKRLLEANAYRCCICKRAGIGFNFHHIDGNPSNTFDHNLAVLCVEDHDKNQRPEKYEPVTSHLDLNAKEIIRLKDSWEAFVAEARKPNPKVIATVSAYGSVESIHSLRLVMQWPDERIEYSRYPRASPWHFTVQASLDALRAIAHSPTGKPVELCPSGD